MSRQLRSSGLRAVLTVWLIASGCGHVPPPYPVGQAPAPATLLKAAEPRTDAIVVSDATMVANRWARGDLAFLAQAPTRFRGSVTKAGNELMTLAFSEEGYGLRYKLDGYPTGFYEGPLSACVIRSLLGVPLSYESLVALVLGGAPLIPGPHEVLEQKWDRKQGFEKLVLANGEHIQELRFQVQGGAWVFAGAVLWTRDRNGNRGDRLWSLEQSKFERDGGVLLPGRTRISAPDGRRDNSVVITYRQRDLDPAFAKAAVGGNTKPGPGTEPEPSNGWDDDETWENEEPAAAEAEAQPEAPAQPPARPEAGPPEPSAIPSEFAIDPAGLPRRGPLCR